MKFNSITVLALCMAFATTVSAQVLRIGVKAGAGIASINFVPQFREEYPQNYAGLWYKAHSGFSPTGMVGGIMEADVTKNFLVSLGLNLTPRFMHVNANMAYYTPDAKFQVWYLNMPLTAHYRAGRFFLGAGGYLNGGIAGKWEETPQGKISGKIVFGNTIGTSNLKRFDFGARAEVGYGFKTVRLSLAYDLGLTNNLPPNNDEITATMRQQAIYATLAYYWLLKD